MKLLPQVSNSYEPLVPGVKDHQTVKVLLASPQAPLGPSAVAPTFVPAEVTPRVIAEAREQVSLMGAGGGQGLGEHAPPEVQVLDPPQLASGTTVQRPFRRLQHAPVGRAQGFGEHVPPWDQLLPVGQLVCDVTVHAPDGLQHAPLGGGQGLGVHAPARQVPVQAGCAATVHVPAALQQAPGQGLLGEQTVPLPK